MPKVKPPSGSKRRRIEGDDAPAPAAGAGDAAAAASSVERDLAEVRQVIALLVNTYQVPVVGEMSPEQRIESAGFCACCYRTTARCTCRQWEDQANAVINHLGGITDAVIRRGVADYLITTRLYNKRHATRFAADVAGGTDAMGVATTMLIFLTRENPLPPATRHVLALLQSAGLRFATKISPPSSTESALARVVQTNPALAEEWLNLSPSESVDFPCLCDHPPVVAALLSTLATDTLFKQLVVRSSSESLNAHVINGRTMLQTLCLWMRFECESERDACQMDFKFLWALLEAAHDDGSGVDLLSPTNGLLPYEDYNREGNTNASRQPGSALDLARRVVRSTTERVRRYRSGLAPALYTALSEHLNDVKDLMRLVGCYIAPRFEELLHAAPPPPMSLPWLSRRRPAAAAAAAAAAATVECMTD
jgi:hypothetical protein